jgi:hypothetical protein
MRRRTDRSVMSRWRMVSGPSECLFEGGREVEEQLVRAYTGDDLHPRREGPRQFGRRAGRGDDWPVKLNDAVSVPISAGPAAVPIAPSTESPM